MRIRNHPCTSDNSVTVRTMARFFVFLDVYKARMLKDQFSETAVISLSIATLSGSVITIKIVNDSKMFMMIGNEKTNSVKDHLSHYVTVLFMTMTGC